MTVGQWLDIWQQDYLGGAKPTSVAMYRCRINKYIRPRLGAVRLSELRPHIVQGFINGLDGLAPTTVRNIHQVLHTALEKAVELDYIPKNPATRCELPRKEQQEIMPLDDDQAAALLAAAKGRDIEYLVTVALFTGLRQSELLGLTWNVIDFENGAILINKQLRRPEYREKELFQTPKSGKSRTITPAAVVFKALRHQRARQAEMQLKAGPLWSNPHGLVFTAEDGEPLSQSMVIHKFRAVLAAAGLSGFHFHSLRHTFAVNSIRAGENIKTVQASLGHVTAAFTLDKYGHVTDRMKQDSAARMDNFIKDVMKL